MVKNSLNLHFFMLGCDIVIDQRKLMLRNKLDGVGPNDYRPSTNYQGVQ